MFSKVRHELYRLHSRWFEIPPDMFDRIHYVLMGVFKIGIFLFNLGPLIALYLMGCSISKEESCIVFGNESGIHR